MRYSLLAVAVATLFIGAPAEAGLTPGSRCTGAGFPEGHAFRDQCVRRVYRERRANFWRNEAPMILAGGLVAGIAANGGSAIAIFSRRQEPGLYRIDVDGRGFLVRVGEGAEATVRSTRRYENVRERDVHQWRRAAEMASGCGISHAVRDFDALYLWLDCQPSNPAETAAATSISSAAPTTAVSPSLTAATPASQPMSLAGELERLEALRARGALTEAEFQAAKARLLAQ